MGIAIGNATNNAGASSFAHNSNSTLLVLLCGSIDNEAVTPSIDSATYGGVAMTRVAHVNTTRVASCLFYLASPAQGSNTAAISVSAGTDGFGCSAISLIGANINDIVEATDSNTGSGTSLSRSIFTPRGGVVLPVIALVTGLTDYDTVPSPATEQYDYYTAASAFALNFGASYYRPTVSQSEAMTFAWGGANLSWAYSALAVNGMELQHQASWWS